MHKLYQEDNSPPPTVLTIPKKNRHKSAFKIPQKNFITWFLPIKSLFKNCKRRLFISLQKLEGKPVTLARGLAIGIFAGCFPFFGLQSLIGVLLATIFRVSKVAAVAGTWISNPLTYIPLFVFNFKIGKFLLGVNTISSQDVDFESLSSFMELGWTFAIVLLVGSSVVGAIASLIGYFVSIKVFKRLQRNRKYHLKQQSPIRKKPPVNLN